MKVAARHPRLFGQPADSLKSFENEALGLFKGFLKLKKSQPWCAEDFTNYALQKGVVPQDLRHMGRVIQIAAKEGLIRRSSQAFARSMGNGSLTLGWVKA
jgi:hypothetical protein